MNRRSLAAALAAILLTLGSLAAWRARRAAAPPDYGRAPDFKLVDQTGRPFAAAELAGKPWVAAFIFTSCGGRCPLMTTRMRPLAERLPEVRFVSFSVDPDDKPSDLSAFARRHRASWTFATGGPGEVKRLSEGFHLSAGGPGGTESILHSTKLVLVDRGGRVRGYYDSSDPAETEALAAAAGRL